jgi:hypothetical protein
MMTATTTRISTLTALIVTMLMTSGIAQTDNPIVAANLNRIAQRMSTGIYERIINLGYIPSPERYKRSDQLIAHTEFTMLFLRFYDFEPVLDGTAYVGKVFMSERYLEKDYNRKYTSRAYYETDQDGFFMACKLYFDERTLEYSINIYPDYLLNICRKSGNPFKGMHFNKIECKTAAQHWESLRYVASLGDKHYDQFSDENDAADIHRFLDSAPSPCNVYRSYLTPPQPLTATLAEEESELPVSKITKMQKNMLREINLRKQIKCFRIAFNDDPAQPVEMASALTLRFTKYALSEDLLDNATYTYTFIPGDKLIDEQLAKRGRNGVFESRNPLYQSLISSSVPDDNFIPGIAISKGISLEFGPDDNLDTSSPDKSQSATSVLKNNVEATSKVQQKQDSTRLDQLQSKGEQYRQQLERLEQASQGDGKNKAIEQVQQQQQQQQQEVQKLQQQQPASNQPYNQIRISSASTSDTSWVYAGRQPVVGKGVEIPKKGAVYRMPANQHLRDTIPVRATTTLWKKGNVKFWVRKGVAEKGSVWQIDTVAPILQGRYQYLWLRVAPNSGPRSINPTSR